MTGGDKVSAQNTFGYTVQPFGLGDLVEEINGISPKVVKNISDQYCELYDVSKELGKTGSRYDSLLDAARIEAGLYKFLVERDFSGFTTNFENLTGLSQLPGIAVQRLMSMGFGFAAEGDWKTAALVRIMKIMAHGMGSGNSFMEDYTYHLKTGEEAVLGAHMLEICPSVASGTPRCEIHPLSIGGKPDPVRLVFDGQEGPGINVSIVDLGPRFRMLINQIECINPPQFMSKLPVGRVLWKPLPNFKTSARCWIASGGSHHTCLSLSLSTEHMVDYAHLTGIECLVIDQKTEFSEFEYKVKAGHQIYGN